MELKWIKLCVNIFDDEKIALIESMPDADSIIVIWFKILCLAGKQNNCGVLMLSDRIPYTEEMLATIFRRPMSTVRLALTTFESFGMIEVVNGTITIPNWEKHQSVDKLAELKEYNRLAQQKSRAKKRALQAVNDMSMTCQRSQGIEEDIDKDIEEAFAKKHYKMPKDFSSVKTTFEQLNILLSDYINIYAGAEEIFNKLENDYRHAKEYYATMYCKSNTSTAYALLEKRELWEERHNMILEKRRKKRRYKEN